MLSLRKQTTNTLILIGIGVFMLALVGCSEKDILSPTQDTLIDFDESQIMAPLSQEEHESHHGDVGNSAMPNNPQSADDMIGGGMMNGGIMMGGMMDGGMMGDNIMGNDAMGGGMMMGDMMGGGMMDGGMMGNGWTLDEEDVTPLTIDEAIEAVQEYLEAINNPDLALAEVMEFSNHFYAEVYEKSTGISAFEILINRYTGNVYPEPGPNMMWNTKYGHMRGKFNGKKPTAEMPVTAEKALEKAQKFLDARLPGTQVAEEAELFYGYYTIEALKDGKIYGMLSVNGYSGQIWYHVWHGEFVGIKEL